MESPKLEEKKKITDVRNFFQLEKPKKKQLKVIPELKTKKKSF